MRSIIILSAAAAALSLGACRNPAPPSAAAATPGAGPAPAGGQSAEQLQAEAAKDEAEANRLLQQANQQGTAAPPAAAPAADGERSLGPGNNKLNSGQFYEALNFQATPGLTYELTYDARGYRPAIIVLDASNQMFSQTTAAQQGGPTYHLEDEIKPDSGGTWHILLAAAEPGAGGSYRANLMTITESTVH